MNFLFCRFRCMFPSSPLLKQWKGEERLEFNMLRDFVLQVSHTSTSLSLSDALQYPSLYRAIPTDFPAIQASIALLKMLNWSRVAIIGEKTEFGLVRISRNTVYIMYYLYHLSIKNDRLHRDTNFVSCSLASENSYSP